MNDNVLIRGLDWWGRIISCSNEIILGNVNGGNRALHFSRYHTLKLILTFGKCFDNNLAVRFQIAAGREEFHRNQRKFFVFIIKYPHLWRQYVDANVICSKWLQSSQSDGEIVERRVRSKLECGNSAYFLTSPKDWNSPDAIEEFERFLEDLSHDELDNEEYYNCSVSEFLQKFVNAIAKFKKLDRKLKVSAKLGMNNNYPGTESGDFTFFIKMMIISLKRSSKEVDAEDSMKCDDTSDLAHDYPIEFNDNERLGTKKKRMYWKRINRLKNGHWRRSSVDAVRMRRMQHEDPSSRVTSKSAGGRS